MPKYRATAKLAQMIVSSEFTPNAPIKSERFVPYHECIVGIGNDSVMKIFVDSETIENNPDLFEEIKE